MRMENKRTCSRSTTFPTLHSRGTSRYCTPISSQLRQSEKFWRRGRWHLTSEAKAFIFLDLNRASPARWCWYSTRITPSSVTVSLISSIPPLFQCLHHRAVNPGTPLPPMEEWLKAALERPEVISECCQAPLEEMKKKFPLAQVEKKKKLKSRAQIFRKE